MIAFVHGMAVDMTESSVVVEAGGIGYEIYMTGADLSEIRMGEDVKVHTYFSVRVSETYIIYSYLHSFPSCLQWLVLF